MDGAEVLGFILEEIERRVCRGSPEPVGFVQLGGFRPQHDDTNAACSRDWQRRVEPQLVLFVHHAGCLDGLHGGEDASSNP